MAKANFDNIVSSHNGKFAEIKTKIESIQNELKRLRKGAGLVLLGNMFFDGRNGAQAYLIFEPIHRYVKIITDTEYISEWKSQGLSDEIIKPPPTFDNSLTPLIDY